MAASENDTKANITFARTPDLNEILHSISVIRPDGSRFHMIPDDFNTRDAT